MDWIWVIPGLLAAAGCVLCGGRTLWDNRKPIAPRGKDAGYDLFQCTRCDRMGSARPREEWEGKEQPHG